MELNIFKDENNESNDIVGDFIEDLTNFLNKDSKKSHNDEKINKEIINENNSRDKLKEHLSNSDSINSEIIQNSNQSNKLEQNLDRVEGHIYLVTSDLNGKIYLWDFTDKPEHEFEEKGIPKNLLDLAKEGSLLQFKNGTYEFYSDSGYDLLFEEE